MSLNVCTIVLFTLVLQNVTSINILGIFEVPSKSLHILGYELLTGLASKGYNVTLVSAFPVEEKLPNFTHVYIEGLLDFKEKHFENFIQGQSKLGLLSLINAQVNLVNLTMRSKGLKELLESNSKYDVIIQTYALSEGYLALAHHFNARVIGFVPYSSFPHITSLTGNSAPYSYVSSPFTSNGQDMTFLQRTYNTWAAHPNTKLFISHGGRGSAVESLYHGVPTLCISFYGDQMKNCEEIVDYGYGIHLPFQEVTESSFEKAFDEITTNPRYKEKAKFRAALSKEQEIDPLDRASFWIQHVHKFKGAKHLQPKSATMPLYQYLLLDVSAFLITIFAMILFILYKMAKLFFKLIFKRKEAKVSGGKKVKKT